MRVRTIPVDGIRMVVHKVAWLALGALLLAAGEIRVPAPVQACLPDSTAAAQSPNLSTKDVPSLSSLISNGNDLSTVFPVGIATVPSDPYWIGPTHSELWVDSRLREIYSRDRLGTLRTLVDIVEEGAPCEAKAAMAYICALEDNGDSAMWHVWDYVHSIDNPGRDGFCERDRECLIARAVEYFEKAQQQMEKAQ